MFYKVNLENGKSSSYFSYALFLKYRNSFSEELWDEISGKTDENNKISREELMEYSFDLYRCPACGSFMVFGDEKTVTKYDFDLYERVQDEE